MMHQHSCFLALSLFGTTLPTWSTTPRLNCFGNFTTRARVQHQYPLNLTRHIRSSPLKVLQATLSYPLLQITLPLIYIALHTEVIVTIRPFECLDKNRIYFKSYRLSTKNLSTILFNRASFIKYNNYILFANIP